MLDLFNRREYGIVNTIPDNLNEIKTQYNCPVCSSHGCDSLNHCEDCGVSKFTGEIIPDFLKQDIVDKLRIRAFIRRKLKRSDRIADTCEEAATVIATLRNEIESIKRNFPLV